MAAPDMQQIQQAAQRYESRSPAMRNRAAARMRRARAELPPEAGALATEVMVAVEAPVPPAPPDAQEVAQTAQQSRRRKQHLVELASRANAAATVADAEKSGTPGTQDDTLQMLRMEERVIAASDLFGVNYLELGVAIARGVARIAQLGENATGFLVGGGILLTNNHVIDSEEDARRSIAQFDYQEDARGHELTRQDFAFDPKRFFFTDKALDFTLVALAPTSNLGVPNTAYPWLPLIETLGKLEKGEAITIVQHPRGGYKQIAFRNNTVEEIPDGKPDFLYYTTDTQPGSSGSPCFNDQWELVALHHVAIARRDAQKQVLRKDGQPYVKGKDAESTIDWIANEGTRISAIVSAVKLASLDDARRRAFEEMLAKEPPNPIELARNAAGGARIRTGGRRRGNDMARGAIEIAISISDDQIQSVRIDRGDGTTRQIGADGVGSARAEAPSAAVAAGEKLVIDPDWSTRKGYDPAFLGWDDPIPLPALSASQKKITLEVPAEHRRPKTDKHALHYHHYSLAFNTKRRMAWYSAANMDGNRFKPLDRGTDDWSYDGRIDDLDNPVRQMGEELYSATKSDRGHLTRFLDVAWGLDKAEALDAAADTFHFTNCALQLQGFNRGKDRWQGMERFLLELKARPEKRRMSVFTGPIFKKNDPVYQNDEMDYAIRIPLEYWKVCVLVRADGTLAATGFRLGQQDVVEVDGFEKTTFDVLATQRTIASLEKATGLDFGILRDHDHFALGGDPGSLEVDTGAHDGSVEKAKPIRELSDIVI